MKIEFREMRSDEIKEVVKVAHHSFGIIESLFMAKPKQAVLAVVDGVIAGGIAYKIFPGNHNKTIGFVEAAFVGKEFAGIGIGNQLYQETTDFLKAHGCEHVITMVRDDNVASWKAFENSGYYRITYMQMFEVLGLPRSLWFWIISLNCTAVGHELWATVPGKPVNSFSEMALYLVMVTVTLLPALRFGAAMNGFGASVLGILALMTAAMLGGFLATRLSDRKWHFRVTRGGLLVSLLVAARGGVFPMVGRYYPDHYNRSEDFIKDMGMEAIFEWIFVLVLFVVSVFRGDSSMVCVAIRSFGPSILLYHALPVFPFGSYGGTRIWHFNKMISMVLLLISLGIMIFH